VKEIKLRRPRVYDVQAGSHLGKELLDQSCGKRLVASLRWLVARLVEQGELRVKKRVQEKLITLSAATVDRLLRLERKKYELKSRARTKPGTLLKHQVLIRAFSEWDEGRPRF